MGFEEELRRELLKTFIPEAEENIQALNQDLLRLETASDEEQAEIIQQLFRVAHNLKGASRAVGLEQVSHLAHKLESIFGMLRAGELSPFPELFDLLYQGVDGISAQVQAGPDSDGAPGYEELLAALEAVLEGESPIGVRSSAAPASSRPETPPLPSAPPEAPSPGPPSPPPQPEQAAVTPPAAQATLSAPTPSPAKPSAPANGEATAHQTTPSRPPAVDAEESVRLSVQKLDELMAHIGELQVFRIAAEQALAEVRELLNGLAAWDVEVHRARAYGQRITDTGGNGAATKRRQDQAALQRFLTANERTVGELHAQADNLYRRMKSDNHRMNQIVGALQEDVRQIRLRPLSVILDSFPRMVRDLARSLGKEVHLVIEGEETEVDRSVVEILKPPLVHLVRNAVDHGIEMPEARRAAGKDPVGQVEIRAAQRGDVIVIEIRDDGAGIDARRVLDKALAAGILSQEQAASMSESEILWLIFRAGFSTRHTVSDISGRGVGLDVVWDALEKIQGSISVSTEPGRGTCFTLTVPLTIATVLCLLVDVQGHTFAAPVLAVDRILHLGPGDVRWVEGAPVVKHHGEPLPLASLAQVLGLPRDAETRFEGPAVLMSSGERHAVLLVDGLLGVQELVVKNLPPPLYRLRNIAGASILGDGRATPILNINDLLLEVAQGQRFVAAVHPAGKSEPATPPTILVADDSVTTRTLERTILETAGYQVHTAVDGADAWEQLQATPVDLVVSDVDMPRMNGFQLTEAIRSHERLQDLPVILVTSLDSPEDRQRGVDAGADAYIVKGAFDQEHLLATIEKFI